MNRRTKYGWMVTGGLLVLFGVIIACKFRDGNRASAQTDPSGPRLELPDPTKKVLTPAEEASRLLPPLGQPLPQILPTSVKPPANLPALEDGTPPLPAPPSPPPSPGVIPAAASGLPPLGSEPRPIQIPASGGGPPPGAVAPPGMVPPPGLPVDVPAPPPSPRTEGPPPPSPVPTPLPPPGLPPVTPPSAQAPAPLPPAPLPPPTPPAPPVPAPRAEVTPTPPAPGEPPLAPPPGPVLTYRVRETGETLKTISRRTLGSVERTADICRLNPSFKADVALAAGTLVRLPGDACVQDEGEPVKPLPSLRPKAAPKARAPLPLTGTYQVNLDDHKVMTLPKALVEQLGNCDTVLVSPGPDKCLWLTNNAHLDRLTHRLDNSSAREADLRVFKRLYYAQTVKVPFKDGRVALTERLAGFAGLSQEVVLVGIDDHIEVWDAAKWRRYTETKKATPVDAE